jgi:NAD+ kinase
MKALLMGRNLEEIRLIVERKFDIVDNSPDIIITHGGDGALLGAEYKYPGIPKLPTRDCITAPLCSSHNNYELLFDDFIKGKLKKTYLEKLSATVISQNIDSIYGINDVFIHNLDCVSALRYKVEIDNKLYANEIIGDGVGLATVHGSTAYYRSITHSIFRIGIGLAFSNSTEVTNHLVLSKTSQVKIKIIRGPAILVADNSPNKIKIDVGDEIIMSLSPKKAEIFGLEIFMCSECRKLRHLK